MSVTLGALNKAEMGDDNGRETSDVALVTWTIGRADL